MRSHKRLMGIVALTILALTVFTGSASAHECFIASRSDQGNIAAGTNSQSWFYAGDLPAVFNFLSDFLAPQMGLASLTQAQKDWAVAEARAQGVSEQLTIFARLVLMDNNPNVGFKAADGKGVDHAIDVLIPIYMAALQH
jgi:hypothetical protein